MVTPPPGEGMLALDFLLNSIRSLLLAHHFALVVEVVALAYGGFSVSCDQVATQDELYAIHDGAIPIFLVGLHITVILSTSMSYLKLVDVPYLSLVGEVIQPMKVLEFIQRLPSVSSIILTAPLRVVCNSAALDMATVYMNITDTVCGARAKEVIGKPLQMGGSVVFI